MAKWCWHCGGEFRDEVLECPDCAVPLSNEQPPTDPLTGKLLIPVARSGARLPLDRTVRLLRRTGLVLTVAAVLGLLLWPLAAYTFATTVYSGLDDEWSWTEVLSGAVTSSSLAFYGLVLFGLGTALRASAEWIASREALVGKDWG